MLNEGSVVTGVSASSLDLAAPGRMPSPMVSGMVTPRRVLANPLCHPGSWHDRNDTLDPGSAGMMPVSSRNGSADPGCDHQCHRWPAGAFIGPGLAPPEACGLGRPRPSLHNCQNTADSTGLYSLYSKSTPHNNQSDPFEDLQLGCQTNLINLAIKQCNRTETCKLGLPFLMSRKTSWKLQIKLSFPCLHGFQHLRVFIVRLRNLVTPSRLEKVTRRFGLGGGSVDPASPPIEPCSWHSMSIDCCRWGIAS